MALNFPDSPTLHQQFTAGGRTWVWNGSAWVAYRGTSTVTAQNSAPSAPAAGSMWFNTITEQTSVYYNSEWVPIATAVTDNSAGDAFTVIQSGAGRAMNVTGDVDVDGTVDATVLTQGGSAVALSSDLSSHSSDTTSVHGITDTANLVYTADARLTDTRTPTDGSVSTAKIADGAVTSAKIANGTIVDEDVSATAAIAQSKIANLTTDLASKASSATVSAHTSATTDVHGIADTSLLATKSYADSAAATAAAGVVDAAPATLDTLNELAAALGDDPNFATTVSTALGNRVRFDAAQTLSSSEKIQARSNISALSSGAGEVGTSNLANSSVTNEKLANSAITINGSAVSLGGSVTIDALPSQTGNTGKYLTTDGSAASWTELNVENTVITYEYTATASQTVFTGVDNNSVSLSFTAGLIQVFLNGVLLNPGDDYTTTTNTVTLASGAAVGDSLTVIAFASFNVANTYTIAQTDAAFLTQSDAATTYATKEQLATAGFNPFLLMGA